MKHRQFKEWLCLSVYDELTGDERQRLQAHLESCPDCRRELTEMEQVYGAMNQASFEVSDQLLREARAQAHLALVQAQQNPTREEGIGEVIRHWFESGYRLAYGGVAMAAVGVWIGYLVFAPASGASRTDVAGRTAVELMMPGADSNRSAETNGARTEPGGMFAKDDSRQSHPQPSLLKGDTRTSNIRIIHADPRTGAVEFEFDAVSPMHVSGNMNDENVRNMLVRVLNDEENAGVRLKAVGMIMSQTETGTRVDPEIKVSLIAALKNDVNPAVRMAALNVLQLLSKDAQIQQALAFTLLHDTNPGVRIAAINALAITQVEGHALDKSVIGVLKQKTQYDKNIFIRNQSRNILEEESQS
jgi:hypothetical protein